MSADLIHKSKPLSRMIGRGPRSVCGQYGYITTFWRSVTCDVCLAQRKQHKP